MKKTIKKIAVFMFAATIISSCETVDFGDINNNPNGPTAAVTSQLLPQAQISVSSVITTVSGINYVQHITEGQYPGPSRYAGLTFSYNGWYTGPIQNLNKIIEVNSDAATAPVVASFGDNDNQIAVSKLLRAYFLHYMTDTWGALPWSEAFKGIEGTQPKFDTQKELYTFMFAEVDDALGRMNGNAGPQGDMLFGGDMGRWATFGNTLKMIMALRISDIDAATAKTKFEQAVASGKLIMSNSQNIRFNYGSDEGSDNPWEDRFFSREDYMMSETIMGFIAAKNDPRKTKYAKPAQDNTVPDVWAGAPNGKVNGNTKDYAFISDTVIGDPTYKVAIYTAAQTHFSLAEAAVKGWNVGGGSAAAHQKMGIEASMMDWGVDIADINTYTAANPGATMADIAYEKYMALYLNGPEAWAEWRRLDAPALTPSIYALVQKIPVRHAYSSSVQDNNPDNYAAMLAFQGADDLHTKLWWDVN
ncbi:SusD/RagB family nutrient-binding outer membrane lipoprotein [Polaribacter uvawellassae]|uniref:SusD/RagB family nutrient-binding outer membrane lipoprotein n=1 Tax=Polaribacter uvawellassae TaxID=3133495 RepID=UPI00321AC036